MDSENRVYKSRTEDNLSTIEPEPTAYYEPKSKLERWLVALACATFFPLVYGIGRAVIYLLNP